MLFKADQGYYLLGAEPGDLVSSSGSIASSANRVIVLLGIITEW
jgi:hypothetical protein